MATAKTTTTKTTKATAKKTEEKIEQVVEEVKEVKETKSKKETKLPDDAPAILQQALILRKEHEEQKKLYLPIDTPYVSEPNKFSSVAGILPQGRVFFVEEEIDNGEKGQFWKIAKNKYINKNWTVEIL